MTERPIWKKAIAVIKVQWGSKLYREKGGKMFAIQIIGV